jgi:hypothetical protein
MNNAKFEQQAVESAQSIAQEDKPTEQWNVMICIRACGGDHTAGLALYQLLYWWPRKYACHKGVKKSLSDWKDELMLGRKQVERINTALVKLGFVEIYQDKWGHFKSPSTFYVLTEKALALNKPLVQKVHMVSEAPAPKGHVVSKPLVQKVQVTENTYKPTKNTKSTSDSVAHSAATKTDTFFPNTITGQTNPEPTHTATPDAVVIPPKFSGKPLKYAKRWVELLAAQGKTVILNRTQCRQLAHARQKLFDASSASGFTEHYVLKTVLADWLGYSIHVRERGGFIEHEPDPAYFVKYITEAVSFCQKKQEKQAEKEAWELEKTKQLAELDQLQKAKAAPAPVNKPSKNAAMTQALIQAKNQAAPIVEDDEAPHQMTPAEIAQWMKTVKKPAHVNPNSLFNVK